MNYETFFFGMGIGACIIIFYLIVRMIIHFVKAFRKLFEIEPKLKNIYQLITNNTNYLRELQQQELIALGKKVDSHIKSKTLHQPTRRR